MSSVLPDPNQLDVPRIAASPLVGRVEYRSSVASTQTLAAELVRENGLPLPLLVLAGEQTAGRGRGQSTWWSSRGALTFSLALELDPLAGDDQPDPRLALAAGLAVWEVASR